MYISKINTSQAPIDVSLREMLAKFIQENEIIESSIADEIGIHKETLSKFLEGKAELKFMQAIRLMKLLDLTESQLVSAYCKDINIDEASSLDKFEKLSYIMQNFDVPTLKKIGIIKSRAKIDEYEQCICDFFGFSSIYEYDDTSLMPTLFSKSKKKTYKKRRLK